MKKTLLFVFAALVLLTMTACNDSSSIGVIGGADGPTAILVADGSFGPIMDGSTDEAYINEALKHTQTAAELAADDELVTLYTTHGEMYDMIKGIAKNDYSQPVEIYKLTIDGQKVLENADGSEFSKLYELKKFRPISFASSYNGTFGGTVLAATSVLSEQEGYIKPAEFKEDFALYLVYDGEFSSFVSFSEIGESVIQANMTFIKNGSNGVKDFTDMINEYIGDGFNFEKIK